MEEENLRTETQIWKWINKGRKRRKKYNEEIKMEEWERYFIRLLEGDKCGQKEKHGKKKWRK